MATTTTDKMETATVEELMAKLASLEAENARIKAEAAARAANRALSCKVSDKGGLSVYGMGRFPVTLYVEQWERLFKNSEMIKAFIKANSSQFKLKGEEREA